MSSITVGTTSYLYVIGGSNLNQISEYKINNDDGNLTLIDTIGTGSNPVAISTIKVGEFSYAYVVNLTSSSISQYKIDNITGILTLIATISVTSGVTNMPRYLSTITAGANSYAYIGNSSGGLFIVERFKINNTGILTYLGAVFSLGTVTPLSSITIGASSYLYAGQLSSNRIIRYKIDNNTGQLDLITPYHTGTVNTFSISTITVGANSYLYSVGVLNNGINIAKINNGSGFLTFTGITTPIKTTRNISTITFGENSYAYLTSSDCDYIFVYKINHDDGSLTSVANIETGLTSVTGSLSYASIIGV